MFYKTLVWVSLSLSASLLYSHTIFAQDRAHRDVRFYKVNKFLQADRIKFTKKRASELGCHNFLKKSRVHRAVQFGYAACTLFTKKNCPLDSVAVVTRKKYEFSTTIMTEGYGWFPESENPKGSKIRSWYCSNSIQEHPVELIEIKLEEPDSEEVED